MPVVPTRGRERDRHLSSRALHTRFPAGGDFVIKPAVSVGRVDTGRYTVIDADSRASRSPTPSGCSARSGP